MNLTRHAAALLAGALLISACGSDDTAASGPGAANAGDDRGCITDFDAGADYFPDKVEVTHSEQWDISYHDSYKVLTVADSEFPDRPDLTYVLVQCGAPAPELDGDLAEAPQFEVPVAAVGVTHNNALAMLDEIGATDTVVGVQGASLANRGDPWFDRVLADAGDPTNLGEDAIDQEVALNLELDLVVMAGFGPGYTEVADAVDRGLPAVMVSNRIEPEPLGSAEWLKFLAAFSNDEATANEVFDGIEAGYRDVLERVEGQLPDGYQAVYACIDDDRGCEFMYAHGAGTLNGRILETLGAENPFAAGNDAGNGMTFDLEQSLDRASGADFFILYYEASINQAMVGSDSRFSDFSALANGDYLSGTDDNYPECGATSYVRVDRLIRDYAIGMVPDLFPGEEGTCFARPA